MKPIVLCILDGCGIRKSKDGNAFKNAKKPNFDYLMKKYPHSLLKASGQAVGLPKGQMGTSEVGHMNIGSGRLLYQPLELINKSIETKEIFKNEEILKVMNHVKENNSSLHLMGLLSDGGVHSHINHLLSLIDMCKIEKITNIYLDLFLDGRDVEPKSALKYIKIVEDKLKEVGFGKISTIGGRYYGMDRDNNFDRLKKSYDTIIYGEGPIYNNPEELIKENYDKNILDEFIIPGIINKKIIEDNDGLIAFNFRKDRLREMLTCITNPNEYKNDALEKGLNLKQLNNIKVVTMMPVVETVKAPHAFNDADMKNILVDYFHENKISQLRIAETEKFAHVTFFFDGGREVEYDDMKKILIPSPKVATYDLKPEMSAIEVTDNFVKEVGNYDVTIINLANGDMVGHTGNYDAAIKAVECLDNCLGRIYNKVKELDGILIVIADHGNCDIMWDNNHNPVTSHTTSLVPCIVTKNKIKLENGRLCDVAPTMLDLMKMEKPTEMNGQSLIKKNKFFTPSIIISLLFIMLFIGIYVSRFIYYYKEEHYAIKNEDNTLVNQIINNNDVVTTGSGLYMNDDIYTFKNNVKNNYISYSGKLFRIVRINEDKSIKIVTDDIVNALNYDSEYKKSDIKKYLDETFYNSLINPDKYVLESSFCIDSLDKDKTLCNNKINSKVGLLTYNDYVDAGANNSYLNIKKYWWIINKYKDNKSWYVFDEGGLNNESIDHSYGVRPVINLKPDVKFISGNGSKSNPYIIDDTKLSVGKYLKYSNYIWKIISINDNIKLVMNDCIKENDKCLLRKYSNIDSSFNKNYYGSIAYYLNNEFYYTLDKSLILDSTWGNDLVTAKVGLLDIYENNIPNTYTLTESNDTAIYTLKDNGILYSTEIDELLEIHPVINISKDIKISGNGDIDNPFIIEGEE